MRSLQRPEGARGGVGRSAREAEHPLHLSGVSQDEERVCCMHKLLEVTNHLSQQTALARKWLQSITYRLVQGVKFCSIASQPGITLWHGIASWHHLTAWHHLMVSPPWHGITSLHCLMARHHGMTLSHGNTSQRGVTSWHGLTSMTLSHGITSLRGNTSRHDLTLWHHITLQRHLMAWWCLVAWPAAE